MLWKSQLRDHFLIFLGVSLCTAIPVDIAVVFSTLKHTMKGGQSDGLAWQLLAGGLPSTFYITAPMACVITCCIYFGHLVHASALQVMFSSGMSIIACARPAIILALTITGVSFTIAWFVAPRGVTLLEDAKHETLRRINLHRLWAGRFYTLNFRDMSVTISFKKRTAPNLVEDAFLRIQEKSGVTYIQSSHLTMTRRKGIFILVFENGSRTVFHKHSEPIVVRFERYRKKIVSIFGENGDIARKKTIPEMSLSELLFTASDLKERKKLVGMSKSEFSKRTWIPMMCLSHVILILGYLFRAGPVAARTKSMYAWFAVSGVFIHAAMVAFIEIVGRMSFLISIVLAAFVVLEIVAGIVMLQRASATNRRSG